MGRLANYHLALLAAALIEDSDLALCMMLLACVMMGKLRIQQSMTVTGSLQGGVAMSQWRFNLLHAPTEEFTRLHRMPKEVFSKLVALCKSCYLKYCYCRVERRLKRRERKVKGGALYDLEDILGMSLEYLQTSTTLDRIGQYFLTPTGVLHRKIWYGILMLIRVVSKSNLSCKTKRLESFTNLMLVPEWKITNTSK